MTDMLSKSEMKLIITTKSNTCVIYDNYIYLWDQNVFYVCQSQGQLLSCSKLPNVCRDRPFVSYGQTAKNDPVKIVIVMKNGE